jgi:hypothetical protein
MSSTVNEQSTAERVTSSSSKSDSRNAGAGPGTMLLPQLTPVSRPYVLPTAVPPPVAISPGFNMAMPMFAVSPNPAVNPFQPFAPIYPPTYGPIYRPAYGPGPMPFTLTPQQQQQLGDQQLFLRQLQAQAQAPAATKIIPANQQRERDYSVDTYLYAFDASRNRAAQAHIQRQGKGPGVYSADELQLIPLQRVAVLGTAAVSPATAAPGAPIVTIPTATAPATEAAATAAAAVAALSGVAPPPPSSQGTQGSQSSMQFNFEDVPRIRLGVDQDHYLAGIAVAYNLLIGLMPMTQSLEDACRSFDVDEDTIAVIESQLETLLYNVTEGGANTVQQNNVRPMLFTFPLHDRYMSIALRLFIYGDVYVDPKTGFKKSLSSLSPWTWRQALPLGDNAFRVRGETPSTEDLALRRRYHAFLTRLYSMMWRSLTRLRVEQTSLYTENYARLIEQTLAALRPASQSVAVLEARIRALAARMQLVHGVFYNTSQFYVAADEFKNIMHPLLHTMFSKYLYFRLQ